MTETAEQQTTNWKPSDKQATVLNFVLESEFECSISAIHKATNIARTTVYNWLNNDPNFREAWSSLWETMIERNFNAVAGAMLKKAVNGDVPAAKLIAEMKGILKQRMEVTGKDGTPIEHTHSSLDGRLADIASRKRQGNDAGTSDRAGKT